MKVAIIAEHDNKHIQLSTLAAVTAAKKFNGLCCLVLLGSSLDSVINDAKKIKGIDSILAIESTFLSDLLAENIVQSLLEYIRDFDVVLAAATTMGKNFMPRLAAKLNVNAYSDVVKIESNDTFVRPIYAGNVLQTVKALDPIKVLTIRATAFKRAKMIGSQEVEFMQVEVVTSESLNKFHCSEKSLSDRPELTEASIVVSGGRGLQSEEQFSLITQLADKLGAGIGASRAAVDAGFISNDHQVGQTGKIVAPELYIAVGISGAIQHLAGIKDSKVIVAINKDPDAPIFQVADYGLVGDAFELVPELINKL